MGRGPVEPRPLNNRQQFGGYGGAGSFGSQRVWCRPVPAASKTNPWKAAYEREHVRFGSKADILRCGSHVRFASESGHRAASRSQACETPPPLSGRLCHARKKDTRTNHGHSLTGANLPPPGLSRASSSLHRERIVGWIRNSPRTHAQKIKRGSAKMISGLHGEQPLIPRLNNRIY